MKKTLALLLALMLLLPACANDADDAGDTTAADNSAVTTPVEAETTPDPTLRENAKDNLPADLNYDGETINIIYRQGWELYDSIGTDNNGDYVTDSIWERNRTVEERLGVVLNIMPTANAGLDEVRNEIKNQLLTGTAENDFYITTGNSIIQAEVNSYLYDFAKMKYIDLEQPWWWMNAIDELSIDGKIYNYLVGDMMLQDYLRMGVVYVNKDLYQDYYGDPDELYTSVIDGTWTLDKFAEISEGSYHDVNGDQTADNGDVFGFIISKTKQESDIHFLIGCDLNLYNRDENGLVQLDMNTERMITALEKLEKLYTENVGGRNFDTGMDAASALFAQGRSMFYPSRLSSVVDANMREMESSYGILPYPKLDEAQDGYVSLIHSSSGVCAMPRTAPDNRVDMIGAVIEAMAAESYRSVVTPFLDTALKVKYSRDSLSGQVIDMVIAGANKNFVFEYSPQTNNIILAPLNQLYGSTPFSSFYAKGGAAAQKMLDKFVQSVQDAMND